MKNKKKPDTSSIDKMQYYTTTAIGDAGVFYLGHWITHYFQWPFRIMSSDIGIDAETEILNDNNETESIFIKIQVKTTTSSLKEDFRFLLKGKHLQYWLRSMSPVLFCMVDLKDSKIYFKNVSCLDDVEKTDGHYHVVMNKERDELTVVSKEKIRELYSVFMQEPFTLMDRLLDQLKAIAQSFSSCETAIEERDKLDEIELKLKKIETFFEHYKWKFGKIGEKRLIELKEALNGHRNEINMQISHLGYY